MPSHGLHCEFNSVSACPALNWECASQPHSFLPGWSKGIAIVHQGAPWALFDRSVANWVDGLGPGLCLVAG